MTHDTNENQISAYMHCSECLKSKPDDQSPADWARLEVGWTPIGLQVWCKRHEMNVIHVDFEGQCHPADTSRKRAN